jgi:hypothetical protein
MRENCFIKVAFLATIAASTVPAHAQFFFIFPLPRGPSDPDKIEATTEQRQYAMCSAYHANVIDPNLSGNRQKSWRGDVMRSAESAMKSFPQFLDLRNRYIRQWQLQMKSSFESGKSYSQMMAKGCTNSGLPYSQEQAAALRSNTVVGAEKGIIKISDREAEPINLPEVIQGIRFSNQSLGRSSLLLDLEITKDGRPKACRSFIDGTNVQLETEACDILARMAFRPKIEGTFPTAGFYQVYASKVAQVPSPTVARASTSSPTLGNDRAPIASPPALTSIVPKPTPNVAATQLAQATAAAASETLTPSSTSSARQKFLLSERDLGNGFKVCFLSNGLQMRRPSGEACPASLPASSPPQPASLITSQLKPPQSEGSQPGTPTSKTVNALDPARGAESRVEREVIKSATSATPNVTKITIEDSVADMALKRCERIGFAPGTETFKSCALEQIRILSGIRP